MSARGGRPGASMRCAPAAVGQQYGQERHGDHEERKDVPVLAGNGEDENGPQLHDHGGCCQQQGGVPLHRSPDECAENQEDAQEGRPEEPAVFEAELEDPVRDLLCAGPLEEAVGRLGVQLAQDDFCIFRPREASHGESGHEEDVHPAAEELRHVVPQVVFEELLHDRFAVCIRQARDPGALGKELKRIPVVRVVVAQVDVQGVVLLQQFDRFGHDSRLCSPEVHRAGLQEIDGLVDRQRVEHAMASALVCVRCCHQQSAPHDQDGAEPAAAGLFHHQGQQGHRQQEDDAVRPGERSERQGQRDHRHGSAAQAASPGAQPYFKGQSCHGDGVDAVRIQRFDEIDGVRGQRDEYQQEDRRLPEALRPGPRENAREDDCADHHEHRDGHFHPVGGFIEDLDEVVPEDGFAGPVRDRILDFQQDPQAVFSQYPRPEHHQPQDIDGRQYGQADHERAPVRVRAPVGCRAVGRAPGERHGVCVRHWSAVQVPRVHAADGNGSSGTVPVPAGRRRGWCTGRPACRPHRGPCASGRRP